MKKELSLDGKIVRFSGDIKFSVYLQLNYLVTNIHLY